MSCDGLGASIKRGADMAIRQGKVLIQNAVIVVIISISSFTKSVFFPGMRTGSDILETFLARA
jgi:aspartate/methionine/tyrosine aminotransferase